MEKITAELVKNVMPHRDPAGHKGNFGKVYCLCGSVGYTGAPVFASRAAVRTGAGLVYLGVPESVWQVVAVKSDEAMPRPLPEQEGHLDMAAQPLIEKETAQCDAVLMGCGVGRSPSSDELLRELTLRCSKPLILDADGINAWEAHIDMLDKRSGVTVLTPHEGEFRRVGGDLSKGREDAARDFSLRHGVYLVLKGHRTLVAAPDGRLMENTTGNSGMAKGAAVTCWQA